MNTQCDVLDTSAPVTVDAFVTVELEADDPAAVALIAASFDHVALAHVFIFAAPETDLEALVEGLSRSLAGVSVSGCTTAGEICSTGYASGRILVVGLPSRHFATRSVVIEDLGSIDSAALSRQIVTTRTALGQVQSDKRDGFAFLMVDGLSLREDILAAAITPALGDMPLFGGSAGDGIRFDRTLVVHDGRVLTNAAVLTFVATDLRIRVFSVNHLRPTSVRMVVTDADPDRRIVREINAEPAAREYARMVGIAPEALDEFTFAAHPVVVRLGDRHHVRGIQRVGADGELVFFAAIEEGMVLTLAEPEDIVTHLEESLASLSRGGAVRGILACDCLLRRIEAERNQQGRAVSEILSRHGVRGFSTYGEQIGPMHLNQTMTGIALYDPVDGPVP
ncbi:MAG: FIST N-terminal domain-containing protein [Pseudomonadota bacterium]